MRVLDRKKSAPTVEDDPAVRAAKEALSAASERYEAVRTLLSSLSSKAQSEGSNLERRKALRELEGVQIEAEERELDVKEAQQTVRKAVVHAWNLRSNDLRQKRVELFSRLLKSLKEPARINQELLDLDIRLADEHTDLSADLYPELISRIPGLGLSALSEGKLNSLTSLLARERGELEPID